MLHKNERARADGLQRQLDEFERAHPPHELQEAQQLVQDLQQQLSAAGEQERAWFGAGVAVCC